MTVIYIALGVVGALTIFNTVMIYKIAGILESLLKLAKFKAL